MNGKNSETNQFIVRTNGCACSLRSKKIMKALRLHRVGSFDGIRWEEVADPAIGEFDVLVKIHAVSLNYRDYGFIKGTYSLVRDLPFILGSDSAGVVVKVGPKVSQFKIGDRV